MESTLKVTGVLSDPTRFNIYQHIIQHHEPVTVLDIAGIFEIHPNVARLHLSKLEEIDLITSDFQRTGRGGRPSRLYQLSEHVVELNFPHRDYKLLSQITIDAFITLGEPGKQALYQTGKKYGEEIVAYNKKAVHRDELTTAEKVMLIEDTGKMLGMYPQFNYEEGSQSIYFTVNNCPFKEVVDQNKELVCDLHQAFLKGMFEALFEEVALVETGNMFDGCDNCQYIAHISAAPKE